jgi:hypothetical protein
MLITHGCIAYSTLSSLVVVLAALTTVVVVEQVDTALL